MGPGAADGRGDRAVGVLVWRHDLGVATVAPLWSAPGHEPDADWLAAVLRYVRAAGAVNVTMEVDGSRTALTALLHDAPVLSTYMSLLVSTPPPALPPGFGYRDMTADRFTAWERAIVAHYAVSNLDRCGGNEGLSRQRAEESFARFLPDGAATADTRLLASTRDDERVGELWVRHHWPSFHGERAPDEAFVFEVAIVAHRRGEGLGRAAMLLADRPAAEVGDREVGLNVFGADTVAVGLYRSLGFVPRTTVHELGGL